MAAGISERNPDGGEKQLGSPNRRIIGNNLRSSTCKMFLIVFFIQPETTADDRMTNFLRRIYFL